MAPDGTWQRNYLLKGFKHLAAYRTVAPGAMGHTLRAAVKLVDPTARAEDGVGSGRYMGLLLHHISFTSACVWLPGLVLLEVSSPSSTQLSLLLRLSPGGLLCV
jgi:hypothetical protein